MLEQSQSASLAFKYDMDDSKIFHRRLDYQYPVITHGKGIYLYDTNGKRYIDAVGGAMVATLGHGLEEIANVFTEYAAKYSYLHGAQFTTTHMEEYADQLMEIAPQNLTRVNFVSGGSEATETAMKLIRQYWVNEGNHEKFKIIHRVPSYHGSTIGALSLTGKDTAKQLYTPFLIPFPSIRADARYRCQHCHLSSACTLDCADELEKKILEEGPETIAAFLVEPVIGSASGVVLPEPGYFSRIKSICETYNILLVLDEILCGFGRTGKWFASQHWNVEADIVYVGKGISAGFVPLAALFCSEKVFRTIKDKGGNFSHGFTYSNHPLTTAVGKAVLDYIHRHNLLDNVVQQGLYLLSKLESFHQFDIVGEVRGLGLLTAVEFVQNRTTREPFDRDKHLAERILQTAMAKGLNLYFAIGFCPDGRGDAVMVAPPYNVTRSEIDEICDIFHHVILEVQSNL